MGFVLLFSVLWEVHYESWLHAENVRHVAPLSFT